ncbi:uncharacterized protein LOC131594663 [Vicia villosa]|uniref:uncharacterized protein LOC131594663 n=1 Tax=Vicia villosa TaxID=3911 RepID=UPI00273C4D7E|nr:uncharacterized protein LOC131594663 [Vicia villosa]
MGEEACYDVRRQLHTQIQQHADLFSKLFYDTVSDVSNLLLVKHLGFQGKEKWMTIPDMGYPVDFKYSVVFVYLSMLMNITFFPLLIAPPPYTSRHTIVVVDFVNSNHWVHIKLRPDCPLPPVTDCWKNNCSINAKAWESAYAGRFRHWEALAGKSDIRKNVSMDAETVVIL